MNTRVMKHLLVAVICCVPIVSVHADATGKESFEAFMKLTAGSTWTTTVDGKPVEHTFAYLRGKHSAVVDGKGGVLPFVGTLGVDPATGLFTWWLHRDDGSVATSTSTMKSEGVWSFVSESTDTKGVTRYRATVTRVDNNTIEEKVLEYIANGIKGRNGTFVWKRRNGIPNAIIADTGDDSWKDHEWSKLEGVWKAPEGNGHRIKRISKGQEIFESYNDKGELAHKSRLDMKLERHRGINFFTVSNRVILFPEPDSPGQVNRGSFSWVYKVHDGKWYEQTAAIYSNVNFTSPDTFFVYEKIDGTGRDPKQEAVERDHSAYTQSGPDVELIKKLIHSFAKGDLDAYRSCFTTEARYTHNAWPGEGRSMPIDELVKVHKDFHNRIKGEVKVLNEIYEVVTLKGGSKHGHVWIQFESEFKTGEVMNNTVFGAFGITKDHKVWYEWALYDTSNMPEDSPYAKDALPQGKD